MRFEADEWKSIARESPDERCRTVEQNIEVAQLLVERFRSGRTSEDPIESVLYARSHSSSDDLTIAAKAHLVMSAYGADEDAVLLREVAMASDRHFRSAVIALAQMCTTTAADALNDIQSAVDEDRKAEVLKIQEGQLQFAQDTGWCKVDVD